MRDDERIAKLEALLARVRSRSRPLTTLDAAGEAPPRPPSRSSPLDIPTPVGAFHPSPLPPPPPDPLPPIAPTRPRYASRPEFPASLFSPRAGPPSEAPGDGSLDQTLSEVLVPEVHVPQKRPPRPPEPSRVRAIEPPPMEVIELEIDPDPSEAPPPISGPALDRGRPVLLADEPSGALPAEEPLESRSRLVSAPPSSLDAPDADGDDYPGHVASDPTIEVAAAEVSRAELEALEADRAPTSSRRPISMEEKMNEDDEGVPLHTPPPESGRLPAASPAFELAFVEPERAPDAPLAHEIMRAAPPAQAEVAVFVGQPPSALAAKTFGELLDDALSL